MAVHKPIPSLSDVQVARFWALVDKSVKSVRGCWTWRGAKSPSGYGKYAIARTDYRAHRVSWTLVNGPIPDGLSLDHLCRNKLCVNPAHLEVVTHTVNVLRGESPTAKNASKTHCHMGHEFTPENTTVNRWNRRVCRACYAARLENRKAAKAWTLERRNRRAR